MLVLKVRRFTTFRFETILYIWKSEVYDTVKNSLDVFRVRSLCKNRIMQSRETVYHTFKIPLQGLLIMYTS